MLKLFPIRASSLIFFSFSAFKFSPLSSTASDSTARVLPRTITLPLLSFPNQERPRLLTKMFTCYGLQTGSRLINLRGQHRGEHDYECGLSYGRLLCAAE